ncbi:MAG: hypothetical protein ACKOCN_01695, partial [Planctomycetaceae bacterium]
MNRATRLLGSFGRWLSMSLAVILLAPSLGDAADKPVSQPVMEKPVSRVFGKLADGSEVFAHTLRVPGGWEAEVIDYG